MREILFRAKTQATESIWVEGFYVHIPCGRFQCDEHLIQTIDADGRIGQLYIVYENTVGQYTGLTDKNGKKIFEGDILQWWSEYHQEHFYEGVVRYGEFNCSCCNGVYGWYLDDGDIRNIGDCEVRGNIHDNPELLEVEDGN